MKSLLTAVVAATAVAASCAAFAQPNGPVTRAQVRAELVQLEQAGYHPGIASPYYPDDIQAAEARVAGRDTSGYGTQAAPMARSGSPGTPAPVAHDSIHEGH